MRRIVVIDDVFVISATSGVVVVVVVVVAQSVRRRRRWSSDVRVKAVIAVDVVFVVFDGVAYLYDRSTRVFFILERRDSRWLRRRLRSRC